METRFPYKLCNSSRLASVAPGPTSQLNELRSETMFYNNPNWPPTVSQIRRFAIALVASIFLFLGGSSQIIKGAATDTPTESQVKAAMIYNFAQFVEWPENDPQSRQSTFVIGVLGEDPIGTILEGTLKGETFQNRKVQVLRLSTLNDVKACQILFVSQSQKKHIPEILDAIQGHSILTVGDSEDFASLGGMIAFKKDGAKIRFQINPEAATRAGLKISSKLLRLAILQDDSGTKGRS
jgi:YfiR/HmsC-like